MAQLQGSCAFATGCLLGQPFTIELHIPYIHVLRFHVTKCLAIHNLDPFIVLGLFKTRFPRAQLQNFSTNLAVKVKLFNWTLNEWIMGQNSEGQMDLVNMLTTPKPHNVITQLSP